MRWAGPAECDIENLWSHLTVHTVGSLNTTRAAWPHMVEQDYGRIIMTTSTGMFGLPENLSYVTAKAAVIGMARSLTVAAGKRNIRINVVAPAAYTRMAGSPTAAMPDPVASRWRRSRSRQWWRSSPTSAAPRAVRSIRPAPGTSRGSSSPRRGATCTPS